MATTGLESLTEEQIEKGYVVEGSEKKSNRGNRTNHAKKSEDPILRVIEEQIAVKTREIEGLEKLRENRIKQLKGEEDLEQ